jgi:hypothetical protein
MLGITWEIIRMQCTWLCNALDFLVYLITYSYHLLIPILFSVWHHWLLFIRLTTFPCVYLWLTKSSEGGNEASIRQRWLKCSVEFLLVLEQKWVNMLSVKNLPIWDQVLLLTIKWFDLYSSFLPVLNGYFTLDHTTWWHAVYGYFL